MFKAYTKPVNKTLRHIVINTKYRKPVLRYEGVMLACLDAIETACKRHDISLFVINIQPEHVHMIVGPPKGMCDSKLLQLIKGISSRRIFLALPFLKHIYPKGNFWSAGYFCRTIISNHQRAFDYVKNQDLIHMTVN